MAITFKKLTDNDIQNLIQSNQSSKSLFEDQSYVLSWPMTFASQKAMLLECHDYATVPHNVKRMINVNDNYYALSYGADPYKDNHFEDLEISLSPETIIDYLDFYFMQYQTSGGQLKLIDSLDKIDWMDMPPPNIAQILANEFEQYPYIDEIFDLKSDTKDYRVKIPCLFKNNLFAVTVYVTSQGLITIEDKTMIIADLSV